MSARRIAVIVASGALVTGGAGAAIAAVDSGGGPRKAENTILADAAKRLNVAPDKLHAALGAAEDAQLDQAVKNGDLTRKQADAIKQRRKASGAVLGPRFGGREPDFRGGPRMHGPGGPGGPGPGLMHPGRRGLGLFSDLSKALGLSDKELVAKLRDGKTVADVAKAQGKSLGDVRAAVKAAAKTRTDSAGKNGDLTRKQADALLQRVDKRLEHLDKAPRMGFGGRRGQRMPPPAANRPGSFVPAPDQPPALDGPAGTS